MNDGGPAFPIYTPDMPIEGSPGMTLRDYFAAKAMQGICANSTTGKDGRSELIALAAYIAADAMLKERNK